MLRVYKDEDGDQVMDNIYNIQLTVELEQYIGSYYLDVFSRVVCDEAQKLKSPHTYAYIVVSRLKAPTINFLIATLIINRPINLLGLLRLMWDDRYIKPTKS